MKMGIYPSVIPLSPRRERVRVRGIYGKWGLATFLILKRCPLFP
jgi:hypothetical protein